MGASVHNVLGGWLECRLGLGRIALPTASIDVLGEYTVGTRLPFNDRVGCAVGVWGDAPVISISLTNHEPSLSRSANAALLVTPGTPIRWAFEISEPIGMISLSSVGSTTGTIPWRRSATVNDGRTIQFIDVPLMIKHLMGGSR